MANASKLHRNCAAAIGYDAMEGVSKCALVEYNAKTRACRDDTPVSSAAFLERLYSSNCIMHYARSERARVCQNALRYGNNSFALTGRIDLPPVTQGVALG